MSIVLTQHDVRTAGCRTHMQNSTSDAYVQLKGTPS